EYEQYLVFTYIVLPLLHFFAFTFFACQLFRRRCTVVLVAAGYTLSGIGLWHSAWFYFQEPFTLFFLLGAWVHVLRRPNCASAMWLLAAVLVQMASLNYWTIYNSWFLLIVTCTHAWIYRLRLLRACVRARGWLSRHPLRGTLLGVLAVSCALLWLFIAGR